MPKIKVKYLDVRAERLNPMRPARTGDAGFDLTYIGQPIDVKEGCTVKLETGIAVKIPDGWVGLVCSRSSTFPKRGLTVTPAVIDSGYIGELFVMVHSSPRGGEPLKNSQRIIQGDRLAQLVVVPCLTETEVVTDLGVTDRGQLGFGSTGG